jgi:hypothetical protein
MTTTEERLEKLERELAREKRNHRRWRAGMLLVVGIAAIGIASLPRLPIHFGEVRARSFVLIDEKGRTSASLEITKDGPALALFGEKGDSSAKMDVDSTGARLALQDENGISRVLMGMSNHGPVLGLCDDKGKPRICLGANQDDKGLLLYDEKDTLRARLTVTKAGAVLELYDENGKPIKGKSHDNADAGTP